MHMPDTRSETPSEFVVASLWRTSLNLIGPFIHPTEPQTRSVARRAMPQSHVAPHHLVCSRAQSTRIICQYQLLNEEIRGRGHFSGATARLCMKLLRDRAGASSRVLHMPAGTGGSLSAAPRRRRGWGLEGGSRAGHELATRPGWVVRRRRDAVI